MLHILQVVGTRPQLVKAAALSRAISRAANSKTKPPIRETVIHTGQHYDFTMSGVFLRDLGITRPSVDLGVGSGSHGTQTGEILKRLEPTIIETQPDVVVAAGDTNSTLAAALCAAKLGVPIAHLEAGLRSLNRAMPEEINRILTDHVSSLLLCPSERAAWNLEREGITKGVHVTGDVMIDALRWAMPDHDTAAGILETRSLKAGEYAIATIHRAENTGDDVRLQNMMLALNDIANELPVVLPAHPRTGSALRNQRLSPKITLLDPIPHAEMLALAGAARIGLTDSGGLQKELYWLGVPCVTMRDETEWVETVETGWNVVAGANRDTIVESAKSLMRSAPLQRPSIYGNGHAAEEIVRLLIEHHPSNGVLN